MVWEIMGDEEEQMYITGMALFIAIIVEPFKIIKFAIFKIADLLINNNSGMLLLFDFTGYSMSHFTQMPLAMTKKLMPCWMVINIIL